MNFDPKTRVAVVTGPGPEITGTVKANDGDGCIEVRLDSGEMVAGAPGDFYELTDDLGRVAFAGDDDPSPQPVGVPQFARDRDPSFAGFYTWGPAILSEAGGTR